MADLIIRQRDLKPYRIKLDKLRTTVGRSSRNDVCVSDPFASRFHIEVRREDRDILVVDLGSANGTLLNGKRLAGQARLSPGDELRIGETVLSLADEGRVQGGARPTSLLWTDEEPEGGPEMTIASVDVASGIFTNMSTGGLSTATGDQAAGTVVKEMSDRRDLLAVVSKVGVALLSEASLDETLITVIDLVFEAIPAQRGFLFLKNGEDLLCKVSRTSAGEERAPTTADIQISRSIARKVFEERVSVLTQDASHDPRFNEADSVVLSFIRSVMAVPLALSSETFGMIYVDNPYDSRFTSDDLKVLTTIAGVASIKIENARLAEERLEKRRMDEELKIASEIQMRLLPSCPPPVPGFQICAYSIPSREIGGGDYYDYIDRKKQGRLALTLGDVSGKGTGAALMMSSLHAAVRAQSQTEYPIREMMSNLNDYISENSPTCTTRTPGTIRRSSRARRARSKGWKQRACL
jgi:putative methionine-R-sulfoxide reductase with GAF domain